MELCEWQRKSIILKAEILMENYWNSIDICFVIKLSLIFWYLYTDIVRERHLLSFMETRKLKRTKENASFQTKYFVLIQLKPQGKNWYYFGLLSFPGCYNRTLHFLVSICGHTQRGKDQHHSLAATGGISVA